MKHHNAVQAGAQQVLDPVCGMRIDSADAAGTSRVGDTTYHFCSPVCRKKFDADPAQFGARTGNQAGHGCCG